MISRHEPPAPLVGPGRSTFITDRLISCARPQGVLHVGRHRVRKEWRRSIRRNKWKPAGIIRDASRDYPEGRCLLAERTPARHAAIGSRCSSMFRTAATPAPHDDHRCAESVLRIPDTYAHSMRTTRATDSVQCEVQDLDLLREMCCQPARLSRAKLFRDLRWRYR